MNQTTKTPEAFERAANLIMDGLEEAFHITAPNGREATIRAVVNVLDFYTLPKSFDYQVVIGKGCRNNPEGIGRLFSTWDEAVAEQARLLKDAKTRSIIEQRVGAGKWEKIP